MKGFSKPSEAQTKLVKSILVTTYFCIMSLLTLTCIIVITIDHGDAQNLKYPTWYLLLVGEHRRFQMNNLEWP